LTAYAGRAYRGRIYVPFPTTAYFGPLGEMATAYVTAQIAYANAISGFNTATVSGRTATFNLIIWHRGPRNFTYVASSFIHAMIATQRRRGDYGKSRQPPI
jgi:hypothetical protein